LLLVKFLQKQNNYSIKSWLINNKEKFLKSKNLHQIEEIYFPRIFLNFWLEDIFINILKIKKKKIKVHFFEGEALNVIQDNENFQVRFKETLRNYQLIYHNLF
tara:strand:- start:2351 stop:2659 length:309 start_codon:yes stop_codon:yes gene_type:complete